jgi:hypothetical protein
MKRKFLGQKIAHIIGEIINNIDKSTYKQLLKFMLKKAKNRNHLKTNNMLVPVENRNQKQLPTPLLLSPRPSKKPSKKLSRIAGKRLGDPQSSPEMRSLAGYVLGKCKLQSLADKKSPLRSVYEPIYFLGKMKPKKIHRRSVYEPIYFLGEMKP